MKKTNRGKQTKTRRPKCISVATHHVTLITTMSEAALCIISLSGIEQKCDATSCAKVNMSNMLRSLEEI